MILLFIAMLLMMFSFTSVDDYIHSDLSPYRVMQRGYGGAKLSDFKHHADRIGSANRKISRYGQKNPDLYFIDNHEVFISPAGIPDSTFFREDMLQQNRKGYSLWAQIINHSLEEEGVFP